MKYLVVKGWVGFGDRLESLKMCVKYALDYNLQIHVDWSDSIWSHNGESFYSYFSLQNIPVLNDQVFLPTDVAQTYNAAESGTNKRAMSYFGRVNYDFDSRGYFGFSIRRDGIKINK